MFKSSHESKEFQWITDATLENTILKHKMNSQQQSQFQKSNLVSFNSFPEKEIKIEEQLSTLQKPSEKKPSSSIDIKHLGRICLAETGKIEQEPLCEKIQSFLSLMQIRFPQCQFEDLLKAITSKYLSRQKTKIKVEKIEQTHQNVIQQKIESKWAQRMNRQKLEYIVGCILVIQGYTPDETKNLVLSNFNYILSTPQLHLTISSICQKTLQHLQNYIKSNTSLDSIKITKRKVRLIIQQLPFLQHKIEDSYQSFLYFVQSALQLELESRTPMEITVKEASQLQRDILDVVLKEVEVRDCSVKNMSQFEFHVRFCEIYIREQKIAKVRDEMRRRYLCKNMEESESFINCQQLRKVLYSIIDQSLMTLENSYMKYFNRNLPYCSQPKVSQIARSLKGQATRLFLLRLYCQGNYTREMVEEGIEKVKQFIQDDHESNQSGFLGMSQNIEILAKGSHKKRLTPKQRKEQALVSEAIRVIKDKFVPMVAHKFG